MKTRYRLLSGLLGMLLLSGCSTVMGEREETGEATSNASADAQTYREVILQLQQQLEEMRQAQLQQADDYEREIAELEAVIAGMTAADESGGTQADAPQSQFTYTVAGEGIVISSYLGTSVTVEIPSMIDGHHVIGIGEGAFRNSSVEQVILPDGVKTVDWFAFYGSYRLRSVTLPASVSLIEYGAFELCSSSLKFTCPSNSYAAKYAVSYGITVEFSDP